MPGGAVSVGSDALLAVLPSTQLLTGLFAPSSDQSWLTLGTVADGVIPFSFTANPGATRTVHITVLGQTITVTQAARGNFDLLEGPAAMAPPAPGGPFTMPVLNRLALHRPRPSGPRSHVLGTTLVFNVPVNLNRRALSLVRHGRGERTRNLSHWVQVLMLVQDGRTVVKLRFRSPHNGRRLPKGNYSLFIRDHLVRNTLTDVSLVGKGGDGVTRLASWHQP